MGMNDGVSIMSAQGSQVEEASRCRSRSKGGGGGKRGDRRRGEINYRGDVVTGIEAGSNTVRSAGSKGRIVGERWGQAATIA